MTFTNTRTYSIPVNYDLFLTCHTHGWINLAPFSWDEERRILAFVLNIDHYVIDVSVCQADGFIIAAITSGNKTSEIALRKVDSILARILGLKEGTSELARIAVTMGRPYERLIENGAGRLLRGSSLWEDAAKTLFTTNCSWALTQRICKRICSRAFSKPSPKGSFPFPDPLSIANLSTEDLRRKIPIGYRAEYLILLAKIFSNNSSFGDLEERRVSYSEAYEKVSILKGFGPYARTHLLILAGYYEQIPVDSEVKGYIKKNYRCRNIESFINRKYTHWGKYRWWGLKFEKMLKRQNWLGE